MEKDIANEPAAALTYGMSEELRNSELLTQVRNLSLYTMEELTARIDEAEEEIDRGDGKSFEEMMAGFKKQLLWLNIS